MDKSRAVGKVHGMLKNLWAVRFSTPLQIKLLLAKSNIIPTLLYGCKIFANSYAGDKRKLRVAYNDIARYVFSRRRNEHISAFSYLIFNISFDNLLNIKCLILQQNIIYTKEPEYLFNRLIFARSMRGMKLIQPRFEAAISERQFFIFCIRLWNNLPPNLISIINSFKNDQFSNLYQQIPYISIIKPTL